MSSLSSKIPRAFLALLALLAGCDSELSVRTVNRFSPEPGPEPLLVTAVEPPADAIEVAEGALIKVTFSRELAGLADLGPRPIVLAPIAGGPPVDGALEVELEGRRLVFRPTARLTTPSVRYRIDLGPDLKAADGGAFDRENSPVKLPSEFTTLRRMDSEPPSFGGIKRLAAVSSSALRAGWDEVTDHPSPQDIVYRAYIGLAPGAQNFDSPAATSTPGATEVLITGLLPSTVYFVTVRAKDEAVGKEDQNIEELFQSTFEDQDTVPPSFDGAREAHALSTTSMRVFWNTAVDDRDAEVDIRYQVYVAQASEGIKFTTPHQTTPPGELFTDVHDLFPDRLYLLAVRAMDLTDNQDRNQHTVLARPHASYSINLISGTLRTTCAIAGCHVGETAANGRLDLRSYAELIEGGSQTNPNTVVPRNAQGSLIIWRTDRRNPNFRTGDLLWVMPRNRAELSTNFLDTLSRWIDQGAANN